MVSQDDLDGLLTEIKGKPKKPTVQEIIRLNQLSYKYIDKDIKEFDEYIALRNKLAPFNCIGVLAGEIERLENELAIANSTIEELNNKVAYYENP